MSLIDPEWEVVDPNPDVYSLFQSYNEKFFWNKLGAVEVKWSPRMYSCAGICTYKGRGGCVVSLSLPLLKLRPRKDLVETLLHEMIHAYLFVTHNNRDHGEHGPEFHKHMVRINIEAGTKITVYHSFHDEVRHYKNHWWRCDGDCRLLPPFYGLVKRAMNRAPGPNDFWFADHQARCNGTFIKIKEPENYKSRKRKGAPKCDDKQRRINSFFPNSPKGIANKDYEKNIKAVNTSNVHGFNDTYNGLNREEFHGGLKTNGGRTVVLNPKHVKSNHFKGYDTNNETRHPISQHHVVPFSGVGHSLSNCKEKPDKSHSCLLSLYDNAAKKNNQNEKSHGKDSEIIIIDSGPGPSSSLVKCPICNERVNQEEINQHLDICVQLNMVMENSSTVDLTDPDDCANEVVDLDVKVNCPCCDTKIPAECINEHLDQCLA